MSDCRYAGRTEPRVVPGRHTGLCGDEACPGCQPCERAHCRVCGIAHVAGACPECMAETRDALREIGRLCGSLPEEVEHRGVEGEAMMLLGPAANPEARGHLEASVAAGRVSPDYLADAIGETHPVWVLGTWEMLWRAELDHDEADTVTLAAAVAYLDQTMSYMASWPHLSFEDFAHDLRRCLTHLEAVLHDGEQIDRGAPCMACRVPLIREWGNLAAADGWRCPRCKEWRSDADYRLNVADLHSERAEWLTDRDMEQRTGIKAGTVRSWSRDKGDGWEPIGKRADSGRVVYRVADVEQRMRDKGLVKGGAA